MHEYVPNDYITRDSGCKEKKWPFFAALGKVSKDLLTGEGGGVMLSVLVQLVQLKRPREMEAGKGGEDVISLNYRDSRPIYEQIKDGLRRLIVTGAMAPDEKLPSVRALATQLSINPNTIQRAYNELENEGYIYSVPGKGSFAAGDTGADAARRGELLEKTREMLAELRYLGVTQAELQALLKEEDEA